MILSWKHPQSTYEQQQHLMPVIFFLLVALEAPTGGVDGTHPGLELLNQAVEKFGVDPSMMEPAWAFIAQQYSPGGGGRLIQNLLTWARQMKQLADMDGA